MLIGQSSCPDCGTPLRFRGRTFVGRTVNCPECQCPLVVELDQDETFSVRKSSTNSRRSESQNSKRPQHGSGIVYGTLARLRQLVESPLFVAWSLAIAVIMLIAITMFRPQFDWQKGTRMDSQTNASSSASSVDQVKPEVQSTFGLGSGTNDSNDVGPEAQVDVESDPVGPARNFLTTIDALRPDNLDTELPFVPQSELVALMKFVPNINHTPSEDHLNDEPSETPKPVEMKVEPIDFEKRLGQKLVSFEQSKPVTRRVLLDLMEEMIGAPIVYEEQEVSETTLNQTVTVRQMENITLQVVLKTILDDANLSYIPESTCLRLHRRQNVSKKGP